MIYELKQRDFDKVKPLFQSLRHQLFCPAVLEGIQPGRVFADDPTNPQTAFIITREVWSYLAGDPTNDAFNRALNRAILNREVTGADTFGVLLSCYPDDWNGQLGVVLAPRHPIEIPRRFYIGRKIEYDWRANVPEGFTLELIDESLLHRPELEIHPDVKNLIESWDASTDLKHKGFGFVALYENAATQTNEIAAHAVIDCVVGDAGDIGLVTVEAYRRRGLATITSAAAIEYGLSHGLSMIHWDCGEDNAGSLRTAEKLGFEYQCEHTMHVLMFDETRHLINLAWNSLDARHYQKTIEACEQIFARADGSPASAYYLMAAAWAGLGSQDKALQHLNSAVEKGWASTDNTENQEEFQNLRSAPEWETVLKRIRKNKEQQETE